mgnify:CR=1 FL=1
MEIREVSEERRSYKDPGSIVAGLPGFDYKLSFEGGLPKINDRDLPRLPFWPQL